MKTKKVLATLLAVSALATVSIPVFAADTTINQAQQTVAGYLPTDSTLTKSETNYLDYELEFYSAARQEKYEAKVDRTSGKLLDFETELVYSAGGHSFVLTETQVKEIVSKEIPKAEFISVWRDYDDRLMEYEVSFKTDTLFGKYTIHPETGTILGRDLKFNTTPTSSTSTTSKPSTPTVPTVTPSTPATPSTPSNSTTSAAISYDEVKKIVMAKAPNATLIKCELDRDDGRLVYEGELREGRIEYDFEVDANTGSIIDWDVDYDD